MSKGADAIVVSGASGLVGGALRRHLTAQGKSVVPLVRGHRADGIRWDPVAGTVQTAELEGAAAVVHLAGENIAGGRWTAARVARIKDSRVTGTAVLAKALASLQKPPRVLVCASAIGYYGNRGDEELADGSAAGTGFLAEVCEEWEAAAAPAAEAGVRVVHLRIGLVLAREGGALGKMLTPFRLGLGGVVGNGRQYMSWISLPDLIRIICYALDETDLRGPVNAVAPNPVTNRIFTKTLGSVLRRITIFPLPAIAVRLLFGEMGTTLLLGSQRVRPTLLLERGFTFQHPDLQSALTHVL